MAIALETVVKQLEDSGIVAAGKLKDCLPPRASPKDAEELVRELVKQHHLTKFQAQHVAAGKTKSLILGAYTILDKIGAGGMGQVFKAQHRRMDRTVAIKMLPSAMTKDAAAVARFEREVRAAAKLEHPNIVTAYDADQANGVHFLVMQYVEGADLSALVKKDGPFSVAKAVNYILQAARGLEFAHGEGVIHRDIKPANLLLDKKGTVKILDMGLARIEQGDGPLQAELTGTGAIMGTVDYMAPEQGLSTKHADARADIYSLGCTLHFLLIGKPAYGGETVAGKLVAHHNNPIPNLCQLRDEVPEPVQAVFNKMVAKKIEDRYQNMTDVVTDLEGCQSATSSLSSTRSVQATATDQESDLSIAFAHQRLRSLGEPPPEYVEPPKKPRRAKAKTKSRADGKPKLSRPARIGLVVAGMLGIGILWAVVIIKMRPQEGTLIVEVNQPGAVVQVLDEEGKVEDSQPGGTKPLSISVVPGKHRIRVEKDGYTFFAQDFEIEPGGKASIKAALAKKEKPAAFANPDRQAAEWVLTAGGRLTISGLTKEIAALADLPTTYIQITKIDVSNTPVSDLSPLQDCKSLETLRVTRTKVTPADVAALQKALPNCEIIWDDPTKKLAYLDPAFQAWMKTVAAMPAEKQVEAVSKKLVELNPGFDGKLAGYYKEATPRIENGFVTIFGFVTDNVTDISPVRALVGLKSLYCAGSSPDKGRLSDLSPLHGMKLTWLYCSFTRVSDLSPLEGMPLTYLACGDTTVSDLAPLKGLPLTTLWCGKTRVTDLSTIQGVPLTFLSCAQTQVSDLSPLRGMPLTYLYCDGTQVSDLSPLRGMPLQNLCCYHSKVFDLSPLQGMNLVEVRFTPKSITIGLDTIRQMKSLKAIAIGGEPKDKFPPAEFWKKYDAGEFGKPIAPAKLAYLDPAFQQWVKATQALPAEQQVEAVSKKLMELNPEFDGNVTPKVEKGMVTELAFNTDNVTDISPVRALFGLNDLKCSGRGGKGRLSDLSPLRGMTLKRLSCHYNKASDLSPLRGMALTYLNCDWLPIVDLLPLEGMPLTSLTCQITQVHDLSPLDNCRQLVHLNVRGTRVTPASVAGLQKALPNCKIEWDGAINR